MKSFKCPKCKFPLADMKSYIACAGCSFKINKKKFNEIVESLYSGKKVDVEDNFERLQNS
jgi:hypothetical protein